MPRRAQAAWAEVTRKAAAAGGPGEPRPGADPSEIRESGYRVLPGWERKKEKSLSRIRLLATPWTVADQAPPSMGFSRQEYWSGLPFPSPEDLPDPGIEPGSPALQADSLPGWEATVTQDSESFSNTVPCSVLAWLSTECSIPATNQTRPRY